MPFIGGEWVNYLIYVSPYFRIIDFILGMMLYLGMKANISENHRPVSATILEIIAIVCAVASLIFYPYVPEKISMASLFWIPSLLLISAFVISAKWGGGSFLLARQAIFRIFGIIKLPDLYDTLYD